jgi:hypothetical protein
MPLKVLPVSSSERRLDVKWTLGAGVANKTGFHFRTRSRFRSRFPGDIVEQFRLRRYYLSATAVTDRVRAYLTLLRLKLIDTRQRRVGKAMLEGVESRLMDRVRGRERERGRFPER